MEHEMSFEELRKELEKVASLKVMEEAVGKPKVTKITATAASGQQGQAGGGGGARQRRPSFLPEGFNPSLFGCLRCGERTEPPHEARNCALEKKDLECTFCGIKGSHVEAVCFKKLEAERKAGLQAAARDEEPEPSGRTIPNPGPRREAEQDRGGREGPEDQVQAGQGPQVCCGVAHTGPRCEVEQDRGGRQGPEGQVQAAVGLHFEDFGGRASKETDSSVGREEGLRERPTNGGGRPL